MPNEALPNKREVMLALLAETSVFVHLDPRGPSVRVPPWFKNQPQLVLQIGLNMAVQIVDLDVSDQGISCTLSFSRRPFFCSIPWGSVFGLVGDNGPGLVWPDDVPAEIAAQVQAQTQAQIQKNPVKKPALREAPRARLRSVGPEPSAGEPSPNVPQPLPAEAPALQESTPPGPAAAEAEQLDSQAAKPQPALKPVQSNRSGAKRELPPYLRVVK